jgi:hypothetical protein
LLLHLLLFWPKQIFTGKLPVLRIEKPVFTVHGKKYFLPYWKH